MAGSRSSISLTPGISHPWVATARRIIPPPCTGAQASAAPVPLCRRWVDAMSGRATTEERPLDAFFLAAADFHAQAAALFETVGHRQFATLARRREAEARRRAHERAARGRPRVDRAP